jgi:cell division transport system permease protein
MAHKKMDARAFAQQKRNRRQWLTFVRMCRYGINNFSRNAWLSLAATAVMTITLLVVFVSFSARNVLLDTVEVIRDNVDMSIYLKTDTKQEDVDAIKGEVAQLSSVKKVHYITPLEARDDYASQNKHSDSTLDALNEATNQFPGILRVNIVDINNPAQLDEYVKSSSLLKEHIDPDRAPSFSGERRAAIQNIARWVGFAERVGIGASILFVAISSLIVFNTIRMAIFNRKEEIQMMRLIGADRNFIRGPFVVEAVFYGFISAVVATGLGIALLYTSKEKLIEYDVAIQSTIDLMTIYIGVVLLVMIMIGAVIGIISSLLATRRYLKI